jgi:hypothetical protein
MMTRTLTALAFAAVLGVSGAPGLDVDEAAAQACLSDNEARSIVSGGQALPFQNFLGTIAAATGGGSIQGIPQLCNVGGQWTYRVTVLSGGSVSQVYVNALTGATSY